jgi:hypothetical protein
LSRTRSAPEEADPAHLKIKRGLECPIRISPTEQPTRKGDISLLKKADGSLYQSVEFPTAEKYADITPRRRQQLKKEDILKEVGKGQHRRITVESLIAYCPPAEEAK